MAYPTDYLRFGNSSTRLTYIGAYEVDVNVYSLTDRPYDGACTGAWAALYDVHGSQLGNWIPLGSACGGRTVALPAKRITTRAGAVSHVSIFVGYVGQATCWRTANYRNHWNC